jgi:hypothetical protein
MPHLPDLPRMALAASSQLPVVVSSHLRNRGCAFGNSRAPLNHSIGRAKPKRRTRGGIHRPRCSPTASWHARPNGTVRGPWQVGKRTCCGCSENCATSESSVACKSTANGTARRSGVIVSVGSFERVRGPVHRTSLRPLARTAHGSARPFGAGRHSNDRYNRHHCAFGRRVRRRSVAVLYEGGPAPRWRASACSLLVARGMPREGRYKCSTLYPEP